MRRVLWGQVAKGWGRVCLMLGRALLAAGRGEQRLAEQASLAPHCYTLAELVPVAALSVAWQAAWGAGL